ncbi:MAG: mercury methylation ferredoxin HgcB [Candidatus Eremiobacterota bacterium]
MFGLKYIENTVTLSLDKEKCVSCGICLEVCPHGVFKMNGRAEITDKNACMECGACAKNCPAEAITVKSGVGCAAAVINGMVRGTEPDCDCSKSSCCGG